MQTQNLTYDPQIQGTSDKVLRYLQNNSSDVPELVPKLTQKERKEATMLKEIGLNGYEISYLIHLRVKERLREKWAKDKH